MEFFSNIIACLPELLAAAPLTLLLTLVAGSLGLIIGTLLALARLSSNPLLTWPSATLMFVVRGTPLLVQLYLIYYGLGQIIGHSWVRHSFLWPYMRDGLTFALFAYTLNQAAYNAEVLRGALKAIPKGQVEAAKSLGMSNLHTLWKIRLPQAFCNCLPILTSDIIILLKSTALASTVTILELMGTARVIQRQSLQVYEPLIACGIVYLAVVLMLTAIMKPAERRVTRFRQG